MKGLFQTMTNKNKNKLVELVQDALFQHDHYVAKERQRALEAETEAEHSEIYESIKTLHEYVADYLIENGEDVMKHGEWIVDRDFTSVTYRCPICKFELTLADPDEKLEYKGCPMCLSMLKEGAEDA